MLPHIFVGADVLIGPPEQVQDRFGDVSPAGERLSVRTESHQRAVKEERDFELSLPPLSRCARHFPLTGGIGPLSFEILSP